MLAIGSEILTLSREVDGEIRHRGVPVLVVQDENFIFRFQAWDAVHFRAAFLALDDVMSLGFDWKNPSNFEVSKQGKKLYPAKGYLPETREPLAGEVAGYFVRYMPAIQKNGRTLPPLWRAFVSQRVLVNGYYENVHVLVAEAQASESDFDGPGTPVERAARTWDQFLSTLHTSYPPGSTIWSKPGKVFMQVCLPGVAHVHGNSHEHAVVGEVLRIAPTAVAW
jgi:hypothetical protein